MVRARAPPMIARAILLAIFTTTRAGFGDRAAIADELAHQPPLVVPVAQDTWAAQFPEKCASASPAATIKGGRGAGNESHALHWWCRSARGHQKAARVTSFVVFKAARTGSEWLSETLAHISDGIRVYFEPMSKPKCVALNRNASGPSQPCAVKLLRGECLAGGRSRGADRRPGFALGAMPAPRSSTIYAGRGRCAPCQGGSAGRGADVPCPGDRARDVGVKAWGLAVNANYFDDATWWADALRLSRAAPRLVILRRTNLVRMALSKYDHGGLSVGGDKVRITKPKATGGDKGRSTKDRVLIRNEHRRLLPGAPARPERAGRLFSGRLAGGRPPRTIDTPDAFARGARLYCLRQQAYSAAVAAHAAYLLGAPLAVVLYEDLTTHAERVFESLFRFLGAGRAHYSSFPDAVRVRKRYPSLCDDAIANCGAVAAAWNGTYPCLAAMLLDDDGSAAWSAPEAIDAPCARLPPPRLLAPGVFGRHLGDVF